MQNLKFSVGIVAVLLLSRFIPHPPNFTALIALSFYIPCLLGRNFIYPILIGLFISDIFLGLHSTMIFTFIAVFLIGIFSTYLKQKLFHRIFGCLTAAILFFMLSNFGVWLSGSYGYTFSGFVTCYLMAIPFFYGTILSSFLYTILFEVLIKLNLNKILSFEKS